MGLASIIPLPTSSLHASIFLAVTQLIYLIVTMIQQMKEYSENLGKRHYDDDTLDDDAEKNLLEENEDFYEFHDNEDVTNEADWRKMRILMGFAKMGMLPERLMRPI